MSKKHRKKTVSAEQQAAVRTIYSPQSAIPYKNYGVDIESGALKQMENACRLPISCAAALMPDAHQGYGLPIGGVLAVKDAVIPYAVGMDIACRMKITILDRRYTDLNKRRIDYINALENETFFGLGAESKPRQDHAVMDLDWTVSAVTRKGKDAAWGQLGTSGCGNHFVEFGELIVAQPVSIPAYLTKERHFDAFLEKYDLDKQTEVKAEKDQVILPAGTYLALLSHSGSRGIGGKIAQYYSNLAMNQHPELPKELKYLAWLLLDSDAGQEYWAAMTLMGKYAAANHEIIHRRVLRYLGAHPVVSIENHHNFAWRETHNINGQQEEVILHRKGATPARRDNYGIIPGSMATPAFVVRGKGCAESLNSASHGAGRTMSRNAAMQMFNRGTINELTAANGVELLSAGIDECPLSYKDIHQVMALQQELVEVIATFHPRLVKMAPGGERGED